MYLEPIASKITHEDIEVTKGNLQVVSGSSIWIYKLVYSRTNSRENHRNRNTCVIPERL